MSRACLAKATPNLREIGDAGRPSRRNDIGDRGLVAREFGDDRLARGSTE